MIPTRKKSTGHDLGLRVRGNIALGGAFMLSESERYRFLYRVASLSIFTGVCLALLRP